MTGNQVAPRDAVLIDAVAQMITRLADRLAMSGMTRTAAAESVIKGAAVQMLLDGARPEDVVCTFKGIIALVSGLEAHARSQRTLH